MKGRGGRLEWPSSLLAILLVASALTGAIALTPGSDSPSAPYDGPRAEFAPLPLDDNLPSWNPNVECAAKRVTIRDILGPAYPGQSVTGDPYETNGTRGDTGGHTGGIPLKRALSPPCTITNISGQVQGAFVEIDGVYLDSWHLEPFDCSNQYRRYNGGGFHPGNRTICDSQGDIYALGSTEGFVRVGIDQDWMARGYCGPGIPPCDNVTIGDWVSTGTISMDVQGFVYWDGENWGIHSATGVRLSTGLKVSVDAPSVQTTKNDSAAAIVRVYGTETGLVSLSVSGCPADVSCAFVPSNGLSRFTSRFILNTTPASPTGTYSLSISATNGSVTTTVPFQLTIADRSVRRFLRGDGGPFSEADDLYISDGRANTNFGSDDILLIDAVGCNRGAGNEPGGVCKSLIKFSSIIGPKSGQIPVGSRIVNASLRLMVTNDGRSQTVYQVTEAWDEASATWNGFHTPGVPGNRGPEFTFDPRPIGPLSLNLTSIVQRWANGEANQGILLASTSGNGTDYNSSESVRERPLLRLEFVPPPQPLLLHYDMETLTADGRMKDLSGQGNHGALSGTTDVAGAIGRARHFDGTAEKASASPSLTGRTSWSLALWLYWDGSTAIQYRHPIAVGGLTVYLDTTLGPGAYMAFTAPGGTNGLIVPHLQAGDWRNLILVGNQTGVRAYLDGALVSLASPFTLQSNIFELGTSGTNWFDGGLDEVRIYSRALNDTEIAAVAPPLNGPGLFFDMENLTVDGRMKDLSGNRSHGTLSGTSDISGSIGRARHFDGSTEKITATPSLTGLASWSFALWLYWDGSTAIQYRHPIAVGGITLYLDTSASPGAYFGFTAPGGVNGLIMGHMPAREWHHVVLVGDSASVKVYFDGSSAASSPAKPFTLRINRVELGTWGTKWFDGRVDEVRVYNRALTSQEIASLLPHPPQPRGPGLFYDMQNLTGDGRMMDLSGNGSHGTLFGTTDVAGIVGGARHFDGGSEKIIATPALAGLGSWSFALWLYWDGSRAIPYRHPIGVGGITLYLDTRTSPGAYLAFTAPGGVNGAIMPSIPEGTWLHVALVGNSTGVRAYLNGTLVGLPPGKSFTLQTNVVELGTWGTNWFDGRIDEVRVYNRSLTDQEISTLYLGGRAAGQSKDADANLDRVSFLYDASLVDVPVPNAAVVPDDWNARITPASPRSRAYIGS